MSDHDEFGAFLVGFIVGGLTGAVVSLLFAPQSGEETRALIKDKSIELRDKASASAEDVIARAEAAATEARTRAEELAQQMGERGKTALEEARSRSMGAVEEVRSRGKEVVEAVRKSSKKSDETSA